MFILEGKIGCIVPNHYYSVPLAVKKLSGKFVVQYYYFLLGIALGIENKKWGGVTNLFLTIRYYLVVPPGLEPEFPA